VRDQILPPQRQSEGVRLNNEDDRELGGKVAQTDKAATGAKELHV
jgi:hypothetical protein